MANEENKVVSPKTTASKTTATKSTASKTTATKTASSKTATTKSTASKTTASKTAPTKATATKSAGTKSTTKSTTSAGTSATKKTPAKKMSAESPQPKTTAPKTTTKSTATKSATPKTAASKAAPKATSASTAPKAAPKTATAKVAKPKVATPAAAGAATASAVKNADEPIVQSSTGVDMTAELSKEAELQKATEGGKPVRKNQKGKKIAFAIILILLIAAIATVGVLVIPKLIGGVDQEAQIDLTNPDAEGSVSDLDFKTPVDEYIWGDSVERGIAVRNTGNTDILVCFKLEIYDEQDGTIPALIDATPNYNATLWTQQSVVEHVGGNPVYATYFYYNNIVKEKSAALILFRTYVLDAEPSVAIQYAERTVYSRVTVQYIIATESGLNSAGAACWQQAPAAWENNIKIKMDS